MNARSFRPSGSPPIWFPDFGTLNQFRQFSEGEVRIFNMRPRNPSYCGTSFSFTLLCRWIWDCAPFPLEVLVQEAGHDSPHHVHCCGL